MLWLYRRENPGLHWADLTGEWPQRHWRTMQDLYYFGIKGEVESARARARDDEERRNPGAWGRR